MNYEPAWNRLLASLNTWADAREVAGSIEVSYVQNGSLRTVEIVMTPEDWEEIAYVIGKEDEDTIKHRLLNLEEDEHFLVSDFGVDLIASSTRELPVDDFQPEPGGQWVVTDEAGNIVSRFADWDDEDNEAHSSTGPYSERHTADVGREWARRRAVLLAVALVAVLVVLVWLLLLLNRGATSSF